MPEISESSFKDCFDKYFVPLCQYAFVYCRDEEQSKEIVQDAFMKIWERKDSLEIKGALHVYLYKTVKNKSLNTLRDQKKNILVHQPPSDEAETEDDVKTTLLEKEHLQQAIDSLPQRCREIFVMKRIEGLSYKDISIKLSVSEKTVENQMGIALKKLKETLMVIKNQLGDLS